MKESSRRVLEFLRLCGADGATEAEIQAATTIRSGAQRIHELKRAGYDIPKVMERSPAGALYARWTLRERRPFVPVTGVQEALL